MKARALFVAGAAAAILVGRAPASPGVAAGPKPVYEAVYAPEAPVLDGRLSDRAWSRAPWSSGFVKHREGGAPEADSRFKVLFTVEGIYLGVEFQEPDMARLHDEKTGMFWTHDVVEVFFDSRPPDGGEPGTIHLILSARGAKNEEFNAALQERTGFKTGWAGAAALGRRSWSAEVFVPFYLLGVAPEPGSRLPANVCRHAAPRQELSSWSFQASSFHAVSGFGELVFRPAPPEALAAVSRSLAEPHFVSIWPRFDEIKTDWDLLQFAEGRALIATVEAGRDAVKPEARAQAMADYSRLEALGVRLRREALAAARARIFAPSALK